MTDAQLKLARAAERIAAVRELVNAWLDGPDFRIESTVSTDGRTEEVVRLSAPPPIRIAVAVGDAVHNLRAALDNAVYASARRASVGTLDERTEGLLEFPVLRRGTRDDFDRLVGHRLDGVPTAVRQVIEHGQPYRFNSDDHPEGYRFHWIWQVHDLDRIDKHRRLALTAAAVRHPGIGVPEGVEPDSKWFHVEGPVVDGQRIASYLGAEMGVQLLHDRGVALVDGPVGSTGSTIGETLDSLFGHVQWTVGQIERVSGHPSS